MIVPKFKALNSNGVVIAKDLTRFREYLKTLPEEVEMIVRPFKSTRSNNQNRYYWGVVIDMIAEEWGETAEVVHEVLKQKFLKISEVKVQGETYGIYKSTADLRTSSFEEFLSKVRMWASKYLNLNLPLPNEIDYED